MRNEIMKWEAEEMKADFYEVEFEGKTNTYMVDEANKTAYTNFSNEIVYYKNDYEYVKEVVARYGKRVA
jgi:hypothetical protein